MNDARPTRETDSGRPLRAQRSAAGLVAQYIHELSDRHGPRRGRARRDSVKAIQTSEGG
jgi:hypothetical protein